MSEVVFQRVIDTLDHVSQGLVIFELKFLLGPMTGLLLNVEEELGLCKLHADSLSFAVQMGFVFLLSQRNRKFFSLLQDFSNLHIIVVGSLDGTFVCSKDTLGIFKFAKIHV